MNNVFKTDQREVDFECEKHGKMKLTQHFMAGKWFDVKCPKCSEEQKAKEESEQKQREEREKQERRRKMIEGNIGRAMIPSRFKLHSFESFVPKCDKQEKRKQTCFDYAERFEEMDKLGRCLIFCGKTGTGKTHLSCSIANHILQKGCTAVFMSVLDAVGSVKETFTKGSDKTEREAIRWFLNPDLLILDEVGVQFGTDAEKMILFQIINKRYEEMKPTILISNLGAEELKDYVGDRVIDRMRENGGKLLNFDWQSHRKTRND